MLRISLVQGQTADKLNGFFVLDHEAHACTRLDDAKLAGIESAALCRLDAARFLIAGGIRSGALLDSVFVYDSSDGSVRELAHMPQPLASCQLVLLGGSVYQLAGRSSTDYSQTQECARFDLAQNAWTRLRPVPFQWKGLHSALGVGRRIWAVLYRGALASYDVDKDTWTFLFDFNYDFDSAFPVDADTFLLVNNYYASVYEYKVAANTIVTRTTMSLRDYAYHFFAPERNCIFWVSTKRNWYKTYDYVARAWAEFGADDYARLFGTLRTISAQESYAYAPPLPPPRKASAEFFSTDDDAFEGRAYVFGNWQQPFVLTVDLTEGKEAAHVGPLSQALELRSGIGLCALDDTRVLVVGGFRDDLSYFETNDSTIYDLDRMVATEGPDWPEETGDTYFRTLATDARGAGARIVGVDNHGQMATFEGAKFAPLPNTELSDAVLLDEPRRLLALNCVRDRGDSDRIFAQLAEFDFAAKQWNTLLRKETSFGVWARECLRIDDGRYLVLASLPKSDVTALGVLTLVYQGDRVVDCTFDKLAEAITYKSSWMGLVVGDCVLYLYRARKDKDLKSVIVNWRKAALDPTDARSNAVYRAISAAADTVGLRDSIWEYKLLQRLPAK